MEFEAFPKIARLKREVVITEKLDGANVAICIDDDGFVTCQSRTQTITTNNDFKGFANWVETNKEELVKTLGPGRHFGEWWGAGIGRGYGLKEKRFSLFNVHRWHTDNAEFRCIEAPLCHVVPTLAHLPVFCTAKVDEILAELAKTGSHAASGFNNPEGIVIFHTQNSALYKVTFEYDVEGKGRNS